MGENLFTTVKNQCKMVFVKDLDFIEKIPEVKYGIS